VDEIPHPDGGMLTDAQQPYNNVVRTATEALAAVLGGTQSLHTNSLDEVWCLPSDFAVQVALRTSRSSPRKPVRQHHRPAGGLYFVEALTNEMENQAWNTSTRSTRWAEWSRHREGLPAARDSMRPTSSRGRSTPMKRS